jgi:hypothetical protein
MYSSWVLDFKSPHNLWEYRGWLGWRIRLNPECRSLEKVRLHRLDGQAKVLGTVVCVVGAVLMSVWKGPAIIKGWNEADPADDAMQVKALLGEVVGSHVLRFGISKFQIGGILLLVNCVSWAAYLIMQVRFRFTQSSCSCIFFIMNWP